MDEATVAQNATNNNLFWELTNLASEIKTSWIKDIDKTDAMQKLNNFITDILNKNETLEEALNKDEKTLQYFMGDFLKEVITNILYQPIVYGNDGDDIALNLLYSIYKLFLKFHKNITYSPLFERIRDILNLENSSYRFFSSGDALSKTNLKIDNPKKRKNCFDYNHEFCSEFMDESKIEQNIFKEGDKVDVSIQNKNMRNPLEKKMWVRGEIKFVDKENSLYIIESPISAESIRKNIGSPEVVPQGVKTGDWEWRQQLKKYDIIDCFDRGKWYPATICDVQEKSVNGNIVKSYKIGFRIYPKFFKNKNDENDKYDNYRCFWSEKEMKLDNDTNEEYFGDEKHCDEEIIFYSKRIQKFQSFTNIQKEFLNSNNYMSYGYSSSSRNKIQKLTHELENDDEIGGIKDDFFFYEKNGKKNYIIGKTYKFSYYFAMFLNKLAEENIFEEYIKIINNEPNSEEIFTIFYTLYSAIPYLHKQYLIDNLDTFKNGIIKFINNLTTKDIRNLNKDLIEIITKFLNKLNSTLDLDKKDELSMADEINLIFSLKLIKTSIFDKRLLGIKKINEFINDNKTKENKMKSIINLINKNEIIKEIFGSNYHSQIISKSDKIVDLLLENNELKEEEIKLIWDCTQRGDLEAKTTIMKLLSDLANHLNETFINILLQNILKEFDKNKINEKEVDFIYNLSIHGDNENNKMKCFEYLYQCILKLELNDNIRQNTIMRNLISMAGSTENNYAYLAKILSICENDLKNNNSSLYVLQILSAVLDRFTYISKDITFLNDTIKEFISNDKLLNLFKDNFNSYIQRAKSLIEKENKKEGEDSIDLKNFSDLVVDNFTHVMNIKQRLEFLNEWITVVYPSFDFVNYLREILLEKPLSSNDGDIFCSFMKKYISGNKANETDAKKEKKEEIKKQLFQIFIDNNQSNMTLSEFKLFIVIFLEINSSNISYNITDNNNFHMNSHCDGIEQLQEIDKLWNVIFQIKNERVLNQAISFIFYLYKAKEQITQLLKKCNDLITQKETTTEIADKCFKLLRLIIIESEKKSVIQTKSHLNLLKNSLIYLPLKISQETYSYPSNNNNENDKKCEIFYGNTTINEIKEILMKKCKKPIKYIEVDLSKEYMTKIKNKENELSLDETYNNKSIFEILNDNNGYKHIGMLPNKIFTFKNKTIEKVKLIENNELVPRLEHIFKEWFNEFTEGTGRMDTKSCAKYISKVTSNEMVDTDDSRIKPFFEEYDREKNGYINEENFIKFYKDSLLNQKEDIVWENLKSMGFREDLSKKDELEVIPAIDNKDLPRYCLGNNKEFIETLFNLFNKFENKRDIFEFLFFLSTNKEIYDNILNNLNLKEGNNFSEIFEKNKTLEQLYTLTIIESIIQDIKASSIDFSGLFKGCKKVDNNEENTNEMKSKNYEYFDEIDMNKKKKFLKEFVASKNYEKLLQYMNKLLLEYKFEDKNKKDNNIVLNTCCEKCLKIINILYISCFNDNDKINKEENTSTEEGIISLDHYNLSNIIHEDVSIKENIAKISFLDFTENLIKFITNIHNYLNSNDTTINNEKNNNLLQNSFSLLINLISYNNKLLIELDSKEKIKQMFSSLIKYGLTCKNEDYKIFYIQCLINSIKNSSNLNEDNKFINLLLELTNNIFNEMLSEELINKDNNSTSKSSILFFDFFSLLCSTKTEKSGNEFLFKIYNILFNNFKDIENGTKKIISNDIFIGLMNILIKRIKYNDNTKNIIINKEIDGKTLIKIIIENIYKKEEKEEKEIEIGKNKQDKLNEDDSKFISLKSLVKKEESPKKYEISNEIKEKCNEYLLECFKNNSEPTIILENIEVLNNLNEKINDNENEEENLKIHSNISKKRFGHVGLKNIGCICYMNSIMQQMYMVPTFRYAIMASDDHENPRPSESGRDSVEDDNLLHQLQIMYTYLTFSEKEDYNPKNFCYSFKDFDGNPINPLIQQDSQEFYNNFCDKIENSLRQTKYKYIVNDVFTGRTCSSVICESCKNVSNRFEEFYNLTLEVKNITTLNDSLHKMIMPEKIDDFSCDACNKKVTINKITTLCDLPNVLVIQLKRFYMNYEIERTEKINSRFEFPMKINLKEFCIENIVEKITGKKLESEDIYVKEDDYYNYELKGINIHMGSADGGHYFSLINDERDGEKNISTSTENDSSDKNKEEEKEKGEKNKWLKFNDSHISIFDLKDIEKECFGGASKNSNYGYNFENFQNAYMLIYERKKKSPVRIIENDKNQENNISTINENIVNINKDNRKAIKKNYDLYRNKNYNINNKDLENIYEKIFFDEERKERYKYVPYYNLEKYAPRAIYNQVMEKNKKIEKMKNNDQKQLLKYRKEFYEIILNNVSSESFDILSEKYNTRVKRDIINIFLESIFNNLIKKNTVHSEEEKTVINFKTKIILEKIIVPFIEPVLKAVEASKNLSEKPIPLSSINIEKNFNDFIYIIIIRTILFQKERLEQIYSNEVTSVFDNYNVVLFSKIIKCIVIMYYHKRDKAYQEIIEQLLNLVQNVSINTNAVPSNDNTDNNKVPLYYILEILYQAVYKDKSTTEKFINQNQISNLLGKLTDNSLCNSIIYDIVLYLIKNIKEYDDKLFDLEKEEKICNCTFYEKQYIINSISQSIVDLLFEEKLELLIMLIKILQYNHKKFSLEFNIQNIYSLYVLSIKKNRLKDMLKIIYAILEINDKYTFLRINIILGYPTIIIKQIKNSYKKKEKNELYEEKKENEEEENNKENIEKKETKEIKNYWPLFGERLLLEDDDDNNVKTDNKDNIKKNKLKKHLYKYIGTIHKYEKYCLLAMLFPEETSKEKEKELIDEKDRIQLIYDLLKLILLGKGNYPVFRYIYLLPSRSLYYNNLYEEMLDILEHNNLNKDTFYDLTEIKKNGNICIKRINYLIEKTLERIKNENYTSEDDYENIKEYKLPEMMEKYYIYNEEVESFMGANPNMIISDIIREEIKLIAAGKKMFLLRMEYFTKYKSIDEIRNIFNSEEDNKITNEKEKIGEEKKEKEVTKEDKKSLEIKEKEVDAKIQEENEIKKEEGEDKKEEEEDKKEEEKEKEEKKEEEEKKEKEEKKKDNESEEWSDKEGDIIKLYDISNIKGEIDGKEFTKKMLELLNNQPKIVIEDSSLKKTKSNIKAKSTLIRFIIINFQDGENEMHINIKNKDTPEAMKHNYYYPDFYIDHIKENSVSNIMNLYRLRTDVKFLKTQNIGINIDAKNPTL